MVGHKSPAIATQSVQWQPQPCKLYSFKHLTGIPEVQHTVHLTGIPEVQHTVHLTGIPEVQHTVHLTGISEGKSVARRYCTNHDHDNI